MRFSISSQKSHFGRCFLRAKNDIIYGVLLG